MRNDHCGGTDGQFRHTYLHGAFVHSTNNILIQTPLDDTLRRQIGDNEWLHCIEQADTAAAFISPRMQTHIPALVSKIERVGRTSKREYAATFTCIIRGAQWTFPSLVSDGEIGKAFRSIGRMEHTIAGLHITPKLLSIKPCTNSRALSCRPMRHTVNLGQARRGVFRKHEKDAFGVVTHIAVALNTLGAGGKGIEALLRLVLRRFLGTEADSDRADGEGRNGGEVKVRGKVEDVGKLRRGLSARNGDSGGYGMLGLDRRGENGDIRDGVLGEEELRDEGYSAEREDFVEDVRDVRGDGVGYRRGHGQRGGGGDEERWRGYEWH